MLWGWRSNLEIAADRGDVEKIRALCAARSAELCRDLAERRLLLTKAAHKGSLKVCQALVEDVGVCVDGAQDASEGRVDTRGRHLGRFRHDAADPRGALRQRAGRALPGREGRGDQLSQHGGSRDAVAPRRCSRPPRRGEGAGGRGRGRARGGWERAARGGGCGLDAAREARGEGGQKDAHRTILA
eukprot:1572470-Rhodomonas_salina.2